MPLRGFEGSAATRRIDGTQRSSRADAARRPDRRTWLSLGCRGPGWRAALVRRSAAEPRLILRSQQWVTPRPLPECDVHTLLRLPTGIFYAQGVKANILFFDRKPASEKPWTEKLWIYDLRTNQNITLKTNPLREEHIQDFIQCYNPENRHNRQETERFKASGYDELIRRDKLSLDIFWLKDESLEDSENLPDPDILARDIVENLEAALELFSSISEELSKEEVSSDYQT